MSYSCFLNLAVILSEDLSSKIKKDGKAFGCQDKPCNCNVNIPQERLILSLEKIVPENHSNL